MKDSSRTNSELIKENYLLKQRIKELEQSESDRKRIEDALREGQQKLITAQRIAKIGDFTWSLETGDVAWSDAMHDIIGYDKTEKFDYAKVNSEIHHPDDLVRITQWLNDCISSGKKEPSQNEYRLIRKDGIIIYVRASVLVEHREDKPITVFGTIQDITEQKQAGNVIKQNEVRYRYISETISDFVYSCIKIPGGEYTIDWMIGATEHISGHTIDEIKAWGCWKNMVDPEYFPIFEDNILNISPGTSSECELKIIRKDGVTRWLRCLTRCLLSDEDNTIHRLYGGCKDITEHKQIESALLESERKFRTLFENSRDAIYITTKEGKFIDFNHAYLELFGYAKEEMATLHTKDTYVNPSDRGMFKKTIERKGSVRDYEVKLRRKDGRQMDCIVAAATRHADDGSISGYQGIIRDITERKRIEQQLHTMSLTDELTGLYNRRGFFTLSEQQLKIAERAKKDMLLFFADLDKLKQINDTLGHQEGDKALTEIATILKEVFRESDIIGRMGGDEFAILAIDTTDETREVLINRLHNILDNYNKPVGRSYQLSLSIGIVHYNPETPLTLDDLMAQADEMMYEEKRKKQS